MKEATSTTGKVLRKNEILARYQDENWNELWLSLMAHTLFRLKGRYGVKAPNEQLRASAEAYISDVLHLVLIKGSRNWNTDEYPSLNEFLVSVIDSHIHGQMVKKKSDDQTIEDEQAFSDTYPSVENQIAGKELNAIVYKKLANENVTDDELLVFQCMAEDGIVKPQQIREELGLSEQDYHNIWRRLKRKLPAIRDEIRKHGF